MQRRKIRILNSTAFLSLLLLPCFKPESLTYLLPAVEQIFDISRVVVLGIALCLYFYQGRISKIFLAITFMQVSRILSTVLNHGDYWRLFVSSGSVLSFCMIIELGIRENVKALFRSIILVLGALCLLNTLTVLLFPDGMYKTIYTKNWLLGYHNVHIVYILPLLCYYSMYAGARKTPFLTKLCFVAIISSSVYITWSATSVVGCTLFLVILLMNELNIRPNIMNCYAYILATIAVFLMIIVFQFLDVFKTLIVDVLHKDMTLTGRIFLWNTVLQLIAHKPLFGYGVADSATNMARLHANHAHNYFLQVVYEGGLINLSCFAIVMLLVCGRLYKERTTKEGFLLSGMLFCFLVMSLDEAYGNIVPFYGALTCMYYAREISQGLSQLRPVPRLVFRKRRTNGMN